MENFFLIFSTILSLTSFLVNAENKDAWGYVNVRPNAYMFWLLYYTDIADDYASKPLIIWLQGGPGGSSVGYGNFMEIGPLDVNLQPRNETWLKKANLLFVDSPVGTGFSYVTEKSALSTSNKHIAQDLLTTLSSIFQTAAEFQKSPLYIFSESYGGKVAVDFALELSKAIKSKDIYCNFKGVALGDPWISPLDSVSTWPTYLYATSFLDDAGVSSLKRYVTGIQKSLEFGQYRQATDMYGKIQEALNNLTNFVDYNNILKDVGRAESKNSENKFQTAQGLHKLFDTQVAILQDDKLSALMNGKIREKLNIPENVTWDHLSYDVFETLSGDFMKPVVSSVDRLLANEAIDVSIYSGQLDLIVNTLGTLKWMKKLKWSGIHKFNSLLTRQPIICNQDRTCGFVKSFKQLSFYWILKAGHMVPIDAPVTSLQMLDMILSKEK